MIPFVFIAGYSNSGKTTVVERLVKALKNRGYSVAAIKHAAHGYSVDPLGKDSWRVFRAGADQMILAGPDSYTVHHGCRRPPALQELLREIRDVDIILVEGFKSEPGPKIELYRNNHSTRRLPPDSNVIALVTDAPLEDGLPRFGFEQISELADFIVLNFIRPARKNN
ncbi:molybdopterin-guanine dinucleotide biosynthesis protein MobB [Desulfocucumis palustris]|uniref:Molybdopterin-guanine dinucleotide biosynthesis protein MobB n=1 Tax=Desulfocucumis palustris TaxID=1898651 RepID=A0A2L2XFR4_9FIRM|nr:molybdopterin-guanine dinucleotide biosynthesis protein B [Desulfocucumis palustris]GBF35199.1 molybdopterin-guanine dinucleotide biosynthesis protein MobB [Desulfocucumis palustris]